MDLSKEFEDQNKPDGEWLKVEDLNQKAIKVTISSVDTVMLPDFNDKNVKVKRLLLGMEGTDKKYVANETSRLNLSEAYGERYGKGKWDIKITSEDLIGKKMILRPKLWDNGKWGILAEAADVPVEEGFGSVQETVSNLAKEFGGTTSMRVESDDDVPF